MNFITFIFIIIIIGVTGDAVKKALQGYNSGKTEKEESQQIVELTRRINELEKRTDTKSLEKRLQALEAIVVDEEFTLNRKFRRAMG